MGLMKFFALIFARYKSLRVREIDFLMQRIKSKVMIMVVMYLQAKNHEEYPPL